MKDYGTDISYPPVGAAEVLGHATWAYRPEICRACGRDVNEKTWWCEDSACPRFAEKETNVSRDSAGFRGFLVGFLLVSVIFCAGLYYHRTAGAGGWSEPQQQIAISQPAPKPEKMSWTEGLTALGIFLGGVGGLAAVARSNRKRR